MIATDPSRGMLDVAVEKGRPSAIASRFAQGDAQAIDLDDGSVDAVSMAFGIRNVEDRPRALREMARVTKAGGRIAILELSEPKQGALAALARFHIHQVVPRLGGAISGASVRLPAAVHRGVPAAGRVRERDGGRGPRGHRGLAADVRRRAPVRGHAQEVVIVDAIVQRAIGRAGRLGGAARRHHRASPVVPIDAAGARRPRRARCSAGTRPCRRAAGAPSRSSASARAPAWRATARRGSRRSAAAPTSSSPASPSAATRTPASRRRRGSSAGSPSRPEPSRAAPWSAFRDASFALPRWLYGTDGERAFLRLVTPRAEMVGAQTIDGALAALDGGGALGPRAGGGGGVLERTSPEVWGEMIGDALARIRAREMTKVVPMALCKVAARAPARSRHGAGEHRRALPGVRAVRLPARRRRLPGRVAGAAGAEERARRRGRLAGRVRAAPARRGRARRRRCWRATGSARAPGGRRRHRVGPPAARRASCASLARRWSARCATSTTCGRPSPRPWRSRSTCSIWCASSTRRRRCAGRRARPPSAGSRRTSRRRAAGTRARSAGSTRPATARSRWPSARACSRGARRGSMRARGSSKDRTPRWSTPRPAPSRRPCCGAGAPAVSSNLRMAWARLFVRAAVSAGVTEVVLSPGSRSTPLAIAAAEDPSVRLHVVVDERSAGFFALGQARVTGAAQHAGVHLGDRGRALPPRRSSRRRRASCPCWP